MTTFSSPHQEKLIDWITTKTIEDHRAEITALADNTIEPETLFLLASSLIELNERDKAIGTFEKCLSQKSDYGIARFQFAFYLFTLGEFDKFNHVSEPLLTDKNYLSEFTAALKLGAQNKFQEGIQLIDQGITSNTENSALNNDMMILKQLFTNNVETIQDLEPVIQSVDDTNVDVSATLLDVYRNKLNDR